MRYSSPFVRSAAVVSLALGLAACGQQVPPTHAATAVQSQADQTSYDLIARDPSTAYSRVTSNSGGRIWTLGRNQQSSVLTKYDGTLNKQWSKSFAYGANPFPAKVVADDKGYAYVVGTTDTGGSMVRYDSAGNVVYSKQNQGIVNVAANNSGNAFVLISSYSSATNTRTYSVAKLSTTGQTLWKTQINQNLNYFANIAVDAQDNVYVTADGPEGSFKSYLFKFSGTGAQVLSKSDFGSVNHLFVKAARIYTDYISRGEGVLNAFDLNGNKIWSREVPNDEFGYQSTTVDTAGNVYSLLRGFGEGPSVQKRDPSGTLVATKPIITNMNASDNRDLTVGSDGRIYVAGGSFTANGFIFRLKP